MATGDVKTFDEAMPDDYKAGWSTSDTIKLAILDNTTAPTVSDATPALGDYTEIGTAGTYPAGGYSLGTWGDFVSEADGVVTHDSTTNPVCTSNGSNDTDAYWGLIYNDTQAGDPAMKFVDLGGPVDLTAVTLTITWSANGITTITRA